MSKPEFIEIQKLIDEVTFKLHMNLDDLKAIELYNQRGMLYLATQEYFKSNADFNKIIELNQSHLSDAYFYKALTSLLLGTTDCESFAKAKVLGYEADWEKFKMFCRNL